VRDLDTGHGEAHTGLVSTSPNPSLEVLAAWLGEQTWSEFAQSLAAYYQRTGRLSEKQEASARSMYAKVTAKRAPAPAPVPVIDGHYALEVDGEVKFYEVRNGEAGGKWEGYTFVDAVASDERYPIRNRQNREAILSLIAAAPIEAMKLYGQEIGVCGHCGRTLTSDWRKVGIGPVCIRNFG
jgi:hypothetical protein